MTSATDTINEAQFKLRELARPMWSDTREASLGRVARAVGLSISQAQRIVYAKCKRIDAHVLDNIRASYAALEAKAERMVETELKIQTALRRELDGNNAADMEPDGMAGAAATQPLCKESPSLEGEGGADQEPDCSTQEND